MTTPFSEEFLDKLKRVKSKRAKIMIEHILSHGFITTEELKTQYGYDHPPRAARDVREQGISLETFQYKNHDGKTIAAYKFADDASPQNSLLQGRNPFSKKFKQALLTLQQSLCAICALKLEERYFQIDHRIPYQVGGDSNTARDLHQYMLLCSSCNRAKSWSCEQCDNWRTEKDPQVCLQCFWANPVEHSHIAMREIRRTHLTWTGPEICQHQKLLDEAQNRNITLPDYIKQKLNEP